MKIFHLFTILLLVCMVSATLIEFAEAVKLRNKDEPKDKKKKASSGNAPESTPTPEPHKPKPKKKKSNTATTGATPPKGSFKPGKPKFTELVDIATDWGRKYCSSLGPLINRPKFSWKRRCDVYYEAIELFINGFSEPMISEFDLTQQEMANRALAPMKLQELKAALKAVARRALESTKTDEKKLQTHFNAKLSQWIMNLAIGKDGSGSNSMGGGAFGGGFNFGDTITEEDKRWAEEVSADDFEDDPEKDDPDFIHKQNRQGGPGGGLGTPIMDSSGNPLPADQQEKIMRSMRTEQAKRDEIDSDESRDL